MVVEQSMTVADVVAQARDGRLDDFVREAVALVARELMEAEITGEIGAGRGEIAPEVRATHRNGYRPRVWETRVGEIELLAGRAVALGWDASAVVVVDSDLGRSGNLSSDLTQPRTTPASQHPDPATRAQQTAGSQVRLDHSTIV
jgi:hypothetical protein